MEEMTLEQLQEAELQAKKEILRLKIEQERMYTTRRLWFFQPNAKQHEFFKHSYIKRRSGFCGNRFGKSTLGVVEDVCWLIGYRPFYPEGNPLRTMGIPRHGVKGLVIAEDWDKVKEIFTNNETKERVGKFFEFLPDDFIVDWKKNEKGTINQITVRSTVDGLERESIVYFDTVKSFKQSPAGFESSDWDFIHIDEPVPKELWEAVSRGLIDRGGYAWHLFTPLKEVWMYNDTLENTKKQPNLYWWFEATMDDNPLLSEEDKQLYLDQLPEDARDARRKGKPLAYGRLVISDYDEDVHLLDGHIANWPRVSVPPPDHMVVYALDTHPQTPNAALFISLNKEGDVDVYDEIWQKCRVKELAALVKQKIDGLRVHYGICEPAAWNEDQGSGFCYADTFYEEGLDLIPGSKRKEDAILQLQQLFKQRGRNLRIHARCKRLRWELINHYFDKDNRPEDKNDHMIECFRRLVIHDGLRYYPAYLHGKSVEFTKDPDLKVGASHLKVKFPSLIKI